MHEKTQRQQQQLSPASSQRDSDTDSEHEHEPARPIASQQHTYTHTYNSALAYTPTVDATLGASRQRLQLAHAQRAHSNSNGLTFHTTLQPHTSSILPHFHSLSPPTPTFNLSLASSPSSTSATMSRSFLLLALLLAVLLVQSSAQSFCETYSATTTNATLQVGLLTAIVSRAAIGGVYANSSGYNFTIPGLLAPSGPLYAIFSGQIQYRVGAPNYTDPSNGSLGILAGKLVAYFGALFGCHATGYPAVTSTYNMYAVHANMSINSVMENYFVTQLALTLQSLGVSADVVTNTAAPALYLFNRCGGPIAALNATAPVQICGTSDCPLANGANYGTCVQYYAYPASSSSSSSGAIAATSSSNTANPFISSSSSGNTSSNAATGKYGLAVVPVVVAAIVASLVL